MAGPALHGGGHWRRLAVEMREPGGGLREIGDGHFAFGKQGIGREPGDGVEAVAAVVYVDEDD